MTAHWRDRLCRREMLALSALTVAALALRLGAAWLSGHTAVASGYRFYGDIAATFLRGDGLCYSAGEGCTVRMPLYPLVVAVFVKANLLNPGLAVFQALVSALLPLISYAIGRRLFSPRVAMLAAAATALNPYAIVHASALQETALANFLLLLGVALLLYSDDDSRARLAGAGFVLVCAVLTTARLALLLPFAVAWIAWASSPPRRVIRIACFGLPILLLLGGWMARNASLVGWPVLTTEAGLSLWLANNAETMEVYPSRSVDHIHALGIRGLAPSDRQRIEAAPDPLREDWAYSVTALKFMASHPAQTVRALAMKAAIAFSGWLSPERQPLVQLGYAMIFVPVNILALIGLWRSRRAGPGHALAAAVFASYLITSTVFWAHTSHRSYMHALEFIYAAAVIAGVAGTAPDGERAPLPAFRPTRPARDGEAFRYSTS